MKKSISLPIFLIISFTSCNNPSSENIKSESGNQTNNDSNTIVTGSIIPNNDVITDTIKNNELNTTESLSVANWKIEDFIINEKDKNNKSLKSFIEYEKEEWKNVENPFIATYQGCDFGDYFHLIFKDANGNEYDFGFGENNFGEYILFDQPDFNDNPKYIGKTFKVYWNWKITIFPCCDGEYEKVEAYLPSITKLELVNSKISE